MEGEGQLQTKGGLLDLLDEFCFPVSPFWRRGNDTVDWHSSKHDEVDLTQCFEDTAILYTIATTFLMLSVLRCVCGRSSKPAIPTNYLNLIKTLICIAIVLPAVADLVYTIYQSTQERVAHYQFLTPIVLAIIMVLAAVMSVFERRFGICSSSLLSLLWLSLVVYGAIKLRTIILVTLDSDDGKVDDVFRLVTFCVELFLFIAQFILILIPEPKSHIARSENRKPCPEETAPFFSRITWWWQNSLFWYGYRRALTYDDLCDLNSSDKSRVIAPKFQEQWDRQLKKAGRSFRRNGNHLGTSSGGVAIRGRGPSIVVSLVRAFGFTFFVGGVLKLFQDLLGFASPQILRLMINYVNDPDEAPWRGYFYACLLFVAAVIQSLLLHQYLHRTFVTGMRLKAATIAAVYRKALLLSNSARRTSTVGEIVNLMSVDAQRLQDILTYLHMVWSAPLQILLSLGFLYQLLGPSVFAGLVVMVMMIPFNALVAAITKRLEVKQMVKKDLRTKLMNEILNGIKVIKLYAWEIPFKNIVTNVRKEELKVLQQSAYLSAATSFTWLCAPFLVALATFGTYVLLGNSLTAEKAFVSLSLLNILSFSLFVIPMLITSLLKASVSIKRLNSFLQNGELDLDSVSRTDDTPQDGEDAVSIVNGTFTWEEPGRPCLKDINLTVKPGELVAVVGQVGAGKSSLVSALLGDMEKTNGDVAMRGRVAYVPQQAWIQNATVKDNILFGTALNGRLYDQTLHACALEPDLQILAAGDMTEIGEKGINLSGGQKQRVSLARSVYQEADIYLLDDPLSAVDSHVGKHIFDKVIGPDGMLSRKARILVTHGLGFLPQCDKIIVMVEGKITEVGTYEELLEQDKAFAEYLRNYGSKEENDEDQETIPSKPSGHSHVSDSSSYLSSTATETHPKVSPTKRIKNKRKIRLPRIGKRSSKTKASSSDGNIQLKVFKLKSHDEEDGSALIECSDDEGAGSDEEEDTTDWDSDASQLLRSDSEQSGGKDGKSQSQRGSLVEKEDIQTGNVRISVFLSYVKACTLYLSLTILLLQVLTSGAAMGLNFWLAHWSNRETLEPNNTDIGVDLGVYAILGITQTLLVVAMSFALVAGAVLGSRTLHDNMLTAVLRSPMSFFDTTPLGRILNRFSKDINTIDEVIPGSLRDFIITLFEVISTVIIVSVASPWFLLVIVPLMVFYMVTQRFYVATSRQLKRLESVSRSPIYSHFQESVTGASSIRAYGQTDRFIQMSDTKVDYNNIAYYPKVCANRWLAIRLEFIGNLIILSAATLVALQRNHPDVLGRINTGLAGLSISYALEITQTLNWFVRMTSELESEIVAVERVKEYSEIPSEAPDVIPNNRPPQDWPIEGRVQFDRYSTKYRADLGLVLKDVTADVPGGQKVGIVGRTGAGKSSLTLALFRIIESVRGAILIDGIDIATIGLRDLRSHITIIPQDPVLFSGTLRVNLDPFNSHTDDEIWVALQTAHLSEFVGGLEAGLEHEIAEGGENISVGQRQLVCLARALLRKTKILVLDEATAAVDMETDDFIQKTIRREFADATVITIAHRLNTIMDYDKIMVLSNGEIVEFDCPNKLLEDKGLFYGMAKNANLLS